MIPWLNDLMKKECPLCEKPLGSNLDCVHCRVSSRQSHRGRHAKINLYLDDLRGCPYPEDENGGGTWHESEWGFGVPEEPGNGTDWHIVRTYAHCIEMLEEERCHGIGILSLDHDLGEYNQELGREVTGYDVLCWLEAKLDEQITFPLPDEFRVHSANPVGMKRMWQVIKVLEKKRKVQALMLERSKVEAPCKK